MLPRPSSMTRPETKMRLASSTFSPRRQRLPTASPCEIVSDRGHDAFLLEEPELFGTMRGFLGAAASVKGIT